MPTWWWGDGDSAPPDFDLVVVGELVDELLPGPTLFAGPPTGTTLAPKVIASAEFVPGPTLSFPAQPYTGPVVTVIPGIDGPELEDDSGRTWQDPLSQPGTGQFALPSGHAALADLDYGTPATFAIDGRKCFTILVERQERREVDPGEEAAQVTTVSGRGLLAEWEDMLVYPDLGAEIPSRLGQPYQGERVFCFAASSGVNDTSWPDAVATLPRYGARSQRFALPDGWPDLTSRWIWDRDSSVSVPQGTGFFRHTFPAPAPGRYALWVAGDDDYEVWFDGSLITRHNGRYTGESEHFDLELGDHFHLVAAQVFNRGGRAGFNATLLPILGTGHYGSPVMHTTAGWRCLTYHEPVRFTVGKVLRLLLAEAQFRGTLLGWSVSFTDDVDSAGRPWPTVRDLTVPVGQDGLTLLNALADQHLEYSCSPTSRRLNAYVIGTSGAASEAEGVRGVNLQELTVAVQG